MSKCRLALLSALLIAGCASPAKNDGVPTYLWQGKEGAAVTHFGSIEKAGQAIERDADECGRTTSQGSPAFDRCLDNRGWKKL